MFGYIVVNKPEIKDEGFRLCTESFYCGLCRELREKIRDFRPDVHLRYDMTFVITATFRTYMSLKT